MTERKRAEEALREAERRWRGLAEALPNLVWTDLPDGQCDYLSSQWGAYTGIPGAELLGLTWLERVIHPDDRERTLACWTAAVADEGVYDLEYRIRRHDGQYRWFKTRGVPIRDGTGGSPSGSALAPTSRTRSGPSRRCVTPTAARTSSWRRWPTNSATRWPRSATRSKS